MSILKIGNKKIGKDFPPVVIAELGINHNGNLDSAISIVDSAIKAGVDIIKHQTHVVEDEMSREAKKIIPANSNKSIYEIIQSCAMSEKNEKKLMNYIKSKKKFLLVLHFQELQQIDWENLIFQHSKLDLENVIIIFL